MKFSFILILTLLLTVHSFCQSLLEKRLTQNIIDCKDISGNSAEAFISYMFGSQYDSANLVLDFWETRCGNSEPVQRAKILLAIYTTSLDESVYDSSIMNKVNNYEKRIEVSKYVNAESYYNRNEPYWGNVPFNSDFDASTKWLAESYLNFDNELERLFCILYSGQIDSFYYYLRKEDYLNTLVRRLYEDEVKTYKALPDAHFFIYSGIFMPTGNAGLLGNHPVIGFNIGIKFDRITLDFASSLRFGSTKDPYLSLKPDTIESHYYFGGYIGLEFYYDLVKTGKYNLSAGAGIGMDGFDTDDYYNYNFYGDYRILTVNGNLGLLNKWFINDRYYIGLSYKYNFVHYNSKYVVNDLTGNFHTIYLGIGGLINKYKRDKI